VNSLKVGVRTIFAGGVATLVTLMAFAVNGGTGAAASGDGLGESCRPSVIVDYAAPLRDLPPLPSIPASRKLDARGVHGLVMQLASPTVSDGPTVIGFTLGADGRISPSLERAVVETIAVRVSRSGLPLSKPTRRVQRLAPLVQGSVEVLDLDLEVGGGPHIYRVTSTFRSSSGKTITRVGSYFRIVPTRVDTRIGLMESALSPGSSLAFRMENRGTTQVMFGLELKVEKREGDHWQPDPLSRLAVPSVGFVLLPGSAGVCQRLKLPATLNPGLYRISKRIETNGFSRWISQVFRVSPLSARF
jgi:hypothetical protein